MATPFNIADWLKFILLQVSNGLASPLPNEPILSFEAPLSAVDDPTNLRTRVSVSGGGVVNPVASSGTTTLTNTGNFLQKFDATGGSVTILVPVTGVTEGALAYMFDATKATSVSHTVSFSSSTSTVKIQDPDTLALVSSLTYTSPRNFTFVYIKSSTLGDFWGAT